MAKIELSSKYIGSSLDNFIVFQNNTYIRPLATFYVVLGQNPVGEINIKDALDDDGFNKIIKYSPNEIITDSSFKTTPGDRDASIFALMECLRKNQIFYDLSLVQDIPNVGMVLRAYVDSSTRYVIQPTTGFFRVQGNYSSYVPKEPNKYVLLENTSDNQITLEKYTYSSDVSFNVTAPYEHLSFKDPFQIKLAAFRIDDNSVIAETLQNHTLCVLPTTLSKFQDKVNLDDYVYSGYGKVNFLTNKFVRNYNYGEICALSLLSSVGTSSSIKIRKKFYTISGKYLSYSDTNNILMEHPYARFDFYFENDIATVENITNMQVGYVEVVGMNGSTEITNPVRYNVEPKCNQNNEIYFVNELGGIDSFNFLGERQYNASIDDQTTYFKNPIRKWERIKEIEIVGQKKNKVEHTLKTTIIGEEEAKWLNELNKSKYAFVLEDNPVTIKKIIITDFDIDLSDRENVFEVELTYQDSDNNINL